MHTLHLFELMILIYDKSISKEKITSVGLFSLNGISGCLGSVGKQSPCLLLCLYKAYDRERVRTAHNFGNRALLFS